MNKQYEKMALNSNIENSAEAMLYSTGELAEPQILADSSDEIFCEIYTGHEDHCVIKPQNLTD